MERAWLQGITGCGSVVAIVDDGMYPDIVLNLTLWLFSFPCRGGVHSL